MCLIWKIPAQMKNWSSHSTLSRTVSHHRFYFKSFFSYLPIFVFFLSFIWIIFISVNRQTVLHAEAEVNDGYFIVQLNLQPACSVNWWVFATWLKITVNIWQATQLILRSLIGFKKLEEKFGVSVKAIPTPVNTSKCGRNNDIHNSLCKAWSRFVV